VALGSLQGTGVTEKNHYHPMNWIKKQKREEIVISFKMFRPSQKLELAT
jgi:hypothetical protein